MASANTRTEYTQARENGVGIRAAAAGRRTKVRRAWLTVHLWLGLSIGLLFVLLGITGSINVFRWEIDAMLNPVLQMDGPAGSHRPWDEVVRAAKSAHQGNEGNWSLQLPGDVSPLALVRCNEPQAQRWFSLKMFWVDPRRAEVVSSRGFGEFFITWIYDLHWSLLLGKGGHVFVGLLGLVFMLSLATGLYLWWPSLRGLKKALTVKRHASVERLMFDLHKTFGLYALPVLFLLAFTGTYLVFPQYVKPLVNGISAVTPDPGVMASESAAGRAAIGIDAALAVAAQVFPDGEPKWVNLPNGPQGVYQVLLRRSGGGVSEWFNRSYGGSAVVVDQYSGKVLHVRDSRLRSAGDSFLDVQWAFHYGEALGLPGRIVWCVTGLVPLVLYVTGIVRWLQKRRAKRHKVVI